MAESAQKQRRRAQTRAGARRVGLGVLGVTLFVGLWKAAYVFNWAPRGTLPDPFEIPAALLRAWRSGHLLPAIGSSLIHPALSPARNRGRRDRGFMFQDKRLLPWPRIASTLNTGWPVTPVTKPAA